MERAWFKHRIALIYIIVSLIIFEKVYETSKSVIDELFHIEQGIYYCHGIFQEWNPKITTLPGLYLLTILTPRCTPYTFRMISLVCSIINFYLIYGIKSMIVGERNDKGKLNVLLDSMSISILPPMYFFSHVYYTDIPSLTTILFTLYFSLKDKYFISSFFGFLSVLMRQTNIVWVAAVFGTHIIDRMMRRIYPKLKLEESTFSQFLFTVKSFLKQPRMIMSLFFEILKNFYGYIAVVASFLVFLYINGSIVVGDKSAHEATIHLPQILYFTLFTLIFGSSLWIPHLLDIIKILRNKKCIVGILLLAIVIVVIIRYNTIVHPYLLADNRHYTFYVWNRLYTRNEYFRYLIIPAYIFGLYVIYKSLNRTIGFKMFYVISTLLTFCLQSLIEVRYFLIPFVVLRLFNRNVSKKWSGVEFLFNLLINFVTFSIFFTREIKWENFEEPQRIIW